MTDHARQIAQAEAEAALARQRLTTTLSTIQARLDPRSRAREVAADLSERARDGVETARQHPGALAGSVAAIGLFLARHRIATLFRRKHETGADAAR